MNDDKFGPNFFVAIILIFILILFIKFPLPILCLLFSLYIFTQKPKRRTKNGADREVEKGVRKEKQPNQRNEQKDKRT